ncbi:hypothetical protein J4H24_23065 [Vibrio alginolyticus]|jgi:hypothetical protein|uniref:DUF6988 family protein n=1 Tax=Vibrio alginolyticus TaxID=663 RepID=UPI001BD412D5|nr:DUF5677 domain-containing protein [Vibrio alginolyticus]MBT0029675.1 hypothetical protein [Vibrio alginolyticus]MBT0055114.1 hypothetical protein [Vibrio alginolyticus]
MNNLQKYIETLDIIESNIVKIKITTDKVSVKAAATLFAIVLDHAQGIKFCLSNSAYPSAFSLLRIIFETYIRGMWLEKCANDMQLDKYINEDKLVSKNNKRINFGDMVLEVEAAHELPAYFSEIKDNIWSGLNSLTHSGSIQLNRNFNGRSIAHCYDDEHINEAIEFSTMIACMSFAQLSDLATKTDGDLQMEKLMEFVESWAFNKAFKTDSQRSAF